MLHLAKQIVNGESIDSTTPNASPLDRLSRSCSEAARRLLDVIMTLRRKNMLSECWTLHCEEPDNLTPSSNIRLLRLRRRLQRRLRDDPLSDHRHHYRIRRISQRQTSPATRAPGRTGDTTVPCRSRQSLCQARIRGGEPNMEPPIRLLAAAPARNGCASSRGKCSIFGHPRHASRSADSVWLG